MKDSAPVATDRVTLLREVAESPAAALFSACRRRGDDLRLVAVKVLRHRRPRDVEWLRRVRDDHRRLARMDHRHLVCATELALVDGHPALLSPWVEGIDLLDWVEVLRETGTPLPGRVVCEVLRGAAAALDAALHRVAWGESEPVGAVHRDVKPSNLMVSRDGELKLLDLGAGFTSLYGRDARGAVVKAGVGRYLSPGRRQGKRGGPASDVYSLGVLGVELLRGRWLTRTWDTNPAHDRHLAEVVAQIPDRGMRSPADDRALRTLLLRMVAFDAEGRPSSSEVTQTLRTLADRATGPSLESFAHAHAAPWVYEPPPVPSPAEDLLLPEVSVVEPDQIPQLEGPTERR